VVVTGDAAVVGMLRPGHNQAILALVQFADRPAMVAISLAAPEDVPAVERAAAGSPETQIWAITELMHSMADGPSLKQAALRPGVGFSADLGPYGFRIYKLTRVVS